MRVPGPGLQRQEDNEMWKSSWQEVVVRARFSAGPGWGLWAFFFFFSISETHFLFEHFSQTRCAVLVTSAICFSVEC